MSYAPDWTESKLRQMGAPLGLGFGEDVTSEEAKLLKSQSRAYWARLTAMAVTTNLLDQINPANKVLSVDLSQESGFKDVKKLLQMAGGNFSYLTSKASPVLRDFATLADPHLRTAQKLKKVFFLDVLPFNISKLVRWATQ